ncbi:DUF1707 domain-containing protein [Streptomyces rectiverticillatus]|uniref:DUF1707 SHOCT-like domain-containing protein n=1 Tax=Streptomyces rectiverticillatus TaxID=173860 RepID=UPI0015C339F0|nr:DUF1707 domain-containing protein [Streptomyces rectiverticillatus]QLE70352.1 DUF1707 domain-containing protein [Streptomyces rectiverticillatus]
MAGDLSKATDSSLRRHVSEQRVSHRDRDQAVEILRVAAGDGRLTIAELDERVEAAMAARTASDLAVLTADLPLEGMPRQAREVIRIDQRFGEGKRTGRWLVPHRMEIRLMFSDLKLDFTEAVITHDILHIEVDLRIGGNLTLVTGPGVLVDADDVTYSRGEIKVRPDTDPEAPVRLRVVLAGRSTGGDIVARPPRGTPRQWLRRKPRAAGNRPLTG